MGTDTIYYITLLENYMIIYKTTNLVNGKFYVGKDVDNDSSYFGSGKILKHAIKKYGKHNFKKEILEVCSSLDELNDREKFWISELNAIENGYNLTEGGTGGDTWTNSNIKVHWNTGRTPWNKNKTNVYSQETLDKIRETKKKFFENHPDKKINGGTFLSGKNHREFGNPQNKQRIDKRVNTLTLNGTYDKLKSTMKGNKFAKQKPIIQFDLEGNFINEYNSVTDAAYSIGIPRHRLYFVLRGRCKQTGGYTFKYKE